MSRRRHQEQKTSSGVRSHKLGIGANVHYRSTDAALAQVCFTAKKLPARGFAISSKVADNSLALSRKCYRIPCIGLFNILEFLAKYQVFSRGLLPVFLGESRCPQRRIELLLIIRDQRIVSGVVVHALDQFGLTLPDQAIHLRVQIGIPQQHANGSVFGSEEALILA